MAALAVAAGAVDLFAEEPAERRYDAGPLTVEDFRAPVPDPLPSFGRFTQLGNAETDIRFRWGYRFAQSPREAEATLTEVDIYAVFLADRSWLSRRDAHMLDHEQGHFDITQLHALEALLAIRTQMAQGRAPVGRGRDVAAAAADLQNKLQELLQPAYDRATAAQGEYDRHTQHGILAENQAQARRRQVQLLRELTAALDAARTAKE